MEYLIIAIKILLFISIINVWFFRFNKATPWRGKGAENMKAEFTAYGLSENFMYLIGGLKVLSVILLIISIWYAPVAKPAASLLALLMAGAVSMHIRVKDPLSKSLPAFTFLVLSIAILIFS